MAASVAVSAMIGLAWMVRSGHLLGSYGLRCPQNAQAVWWGLPHLLSPILTAFSRFQVSTSLVVAHLVFTVLVALNEEIWFRGLMLAALGKKQPESAVAISAVLFGVLHLSNAFGGNRIPHGQPVDRHRLAFSAQFCRHDHRRRSYLDKLDCQWRVPHAGDLLVAKARQLMELTTIRRDYAKAGLRVLENAGWASVSYLGVAKEAGKSLGAIQKAFPRKEQLLEAMFVVLRDQAAVPAICQPDKPDLRTWLTNLSLHILPLDSERLTKERMGASFVQLADANSAFARALREADREVIESVAQLIDRESSGGRRKARVWFALMGGYAEQLRYDPRPEVEVRAEIEFAVEKLLGENAYPPADLLG